MLRALRERGSIAVVDDDESVRAAIQGVIRSVGLTPVSFASAEEFLASDVVHDAACVITDLMMPGMNGLELQQRLNENGAVPVILVSAHGDDRVRERAMKAGAVGFLDKPFNDDALIELVRSALTK